MKILLNIIKFIIKFALIFMIFFIWLRYALASNIQAVLIALLCSVIVSSLLNIFTKNIKENIFLKSKEEKEAIKMFDNLIQNRNYDFFFQLSKSRHKLVTKKRICTIIEHNEGKIMIYPYLKMKPLDKDTVISISLLASKSKIAKVVICAKSVENDVENFSKNLSLDIVILNQYECYQFLFKEYDFYPQQTKITTSSKNKLKQIMNYALNRSRTKGYVISALLLLAISFFIRQSIYYCIIATLLLLLALFSMHNTSKIKNTKSI